MSDTRETAICLELDLDLSLVIEIWLRVFVYSHCFYSQSNVYCFLKLPFRVPKGFGIARCFGLYQYQLLCIVLLCQGGCERNVWGRG